MGEGGDAAAKTFASRDELRSSISVSRRHFHLNGVSFENKQDLQIKNAPSGRRPNPIGSSAVARSFIPAGGYST
jgi:hypothetical protein